MTGDACCWVHMSLRLLTRMPSLKEMSFSAIQAVFWWTFRNLWGQQECGLWGNKSAFLGWFLAPAYPGSALCHWGSAALSSGTCEWNCARFGAPALPLLLQECGCAALLLLPCPYSTWGMQQLSSWKIKTHGHIGAGWGATFKQHKIVWLHL